MKSVQFFMAAAVTLAAPISANAATLSLSVTADNAFSVYLSTDNSVLGTLVGTNFGGPAGQWSTSFSYSATLNPLNPIYFVHVVGTNYNSANGLWPDAGTPNGTSPNPNAFLGQLSVDGGYTFANGGTSINTNAIAGQWYGVAAADNTSWTTPSSAVQSFGTNGGSNIWTGAIGGPVGGISTSAEWIWSLPDNADYADLSTQITLLSPALTTPLPGALPLFVSGLVALGLVGRRRKRAKASARVA